MQFDIEVVRTGRRMREVSTRELLLHINSLVDEDAPIVVNRKVTFRSEEKWKHACAKEIDAGRLIFAIGWFKKRLAGLAEARRGLGRESGVVKLGIGIGKEFRERGLGRMLLMEIICAAKKEFEPGKIILECFECNTPAIRLYKSTGFQKVALLKSHAVLYGKPCGKLIMELKNRQG